MAVLADIRPETAAGEGSSVLDGGVQLAQEDRRGPRPGAAADRLAHVNPVSRLPVSGGAGLQSLREAAERYAARGWPVLPGPACDGIATWHPNKTAPARPGEAAVDVSAATTDPGVIGEWWSHRRHTVVVQSGRRFDVLRTPTLLGWRAMAAFGGRRPLGPVAVAPQGVFFLVEAGIPLDRRLCEAAGVDLMAPGTLVTLPPSRVFGGAVSWRISPEDIEALGDSGQIQDKLADLLACPDPAQPGNSLPGLGGRPYAERAGVGVRGGACTAVSR
ncbi:bifunctional DNA primase/polymerase [Amycolatopsis sp. NPDC004079]|uniref:bifunctional DNA primase/polymerase n=1 Tax=Amycolatopsis sp. NPDC004079 TaxID=3154549 RepID=UPI0033B687F2